MNILITAPSLNESENVSGISSIVRSITGFKNSPHQFHHFRIGTKDGDGKGISWAADQARLLPRMAKFIRQKNIDAVHLNTDFTKASVLRDFVIVSFLHSIVRKPVLLHVHGGYMLMAPPKRKSFYWLLIRRMLKRSAVTVILTKAEQDQLRAVFDVESQVLANAVPDLDEIPVKKDFTNSLNIFFLGKIVRTKGVFLIAEALRLVSEYHQKIRFVLYGAGPDLPGLLNELNEIKTLRFEYKGVVFGREKEKALDNGHVFLLPSYSEGLPIALLEAMQFGCIPVVTNEPSMMAVVENSKNGIIIIKDSAEAVAGALKSILTGRDQLQQMSEAAFATVAQHYSISGYMRSLSAYYTAFLN